MDQTFDTLAFSLVEIDGRLSGCHSDALVQHVVNTVEVERPKITKQTVQKPIIEEKINQVSMVQKAMEAPQVQVVEKTVDGPQLQIVEKTAETPETQTIQDAQTSESLGIAPEYQLAQAETAEVDKNGAPFLTEFVLPMFVSTPVLETLPAVVEFVQPVPAVEVVARARSITYAHAAPVVEFINGASPVTYAAQGASFQIPQEIVYEQPALVYFACVRGQWKPAC